MGSLIKSIGCLVTDIGEELGGYEKSAHYMRGPGPKWHAKHGSSQQQVGGSFPRVVADSDTAKVAPDSLGALLRPR